MKKRMMAWGLLLLMVLSLFSGCKQVDAAGQAAAPSEEVVNTPVTEKTEQDVPMVVPPVETEPEQEDIAEQPVQKEEEPAKEPVEETPAQEEIKEPGDTTTKQPAQNEEEEPAQEEPEKSNEAEPSGEDKKIYSNADMSTRLIPGELSVMLKKEYSADNKEWTLADFPTVKAVSITPRADFSKIDFSKNPYFRKMYKLELEEKTKEATLEAIYELEKMDCVYQVVLHGYDISFEVA